LKKIGIRVSFCEFLGNQHEWSRTTLEWSRTLGVVAPVLINKGKCAWSGRAHLWSGRAPSQTLEFAEMAQISLSLPFAREFLLQMHNEGDQRGKLAFIGSF